MVTALTASCAPATIATTPTPLVPTTTPSPTITTFPTSTPTENCSLNTAHCLLNTENCSPNTAHCSPPTENCSLKTALCSPLAVLSLDEIPTYITQPFIPPSLGHNAEHPDWVRKDDGHYGMDIGYYQRDGKLFTGTPVQAALAGQIASIVHDRPPYGNMLIVETPFEGIPPALVVAQSIPAGDSLYTLYAHLQNLEALEIGQSVACGQQLAETGLTGFTGGPHLHFETHWGPPGQTFTSMAYYRADASPEELHNYETWRLTDAFHLFDPMELLKLQVTG